MALLLVLLLGMALGVCLVGLLLVLHFVRSGHVKDVGIASKLWEKSTRAQRNGLPYGPFRWLAIHNVPPHVVQRALNVHNPTPCSWKKGLAALHDQPVFISPPIAGWVLVFGSFLPDPAQDIDRCFRFLTNLSRQLGHVHFFAVNRLMHHHTWAKLERGTVKRAYSWAGQTLWNQGLPTQAEQELGIRCYGYGESPAPQRDTRMNATMLNTERLAFLAGRWSVDPSALDDRLFRDSSGIAGEITNHKHQ